MKYGWILKRSNMFVFGKQWIQEGKYVKEMKDAFVYKTRKGAREDKLSFEIVLKVSLDMRGKPVRVIGRVDYDNY